MAESRPIVLALGLLLVFSPAQARNYYVSPSGSDSAAGTLNQPFQTVQKAALGMVAGDTAYIRAGVYRETVRPANSGTQNAPITYTPFALNAQNSCGTTSLAAKPDYQFAVGTSDTAGTCAFSLAGQAIAKVITSSYIVLFPNHSSPQRSSGVAPANAVAGTQSRTVLNRSNRVRKTQTLFDTSLDSPCAQSLWMGRK